MGTTSYPTAKARGRLTTDRASVASRLFGALPFFVIGLSANFSSARALAAAAQDEKRAPHDREARTPINFMRLRLQTVDGVLVIYDAYPPVAGARDAGPSLGLWHDLALRDFFVFGRLIESPTDAGHALLNLSRDVGADIEMLSVDGSGFSTWLRRVRAAGEDPTSWEKATPDRLAALLGVSIETVAEGAGSNEKNLKPMGQLARGCCQVGEPCCRAAAMRPDWRPIGVPKKELSQKELLTTVVAAGACCPGDGDPDPPPCSCCGSSDPCCGDPCCGDPCCNDPCCEDPCCGDAACCEDRCCQGSDCCNSPDPCCDTSSPCCGNPDRCCHSDNPCCGSSNPCCNQYDPCCGSPDECCNSDNPCCGTGAGPCCDSSDLCCNVDCNDNNACTDDYCEGGSCLNPPKCPGGCCNGECCADGDDESCCNGSCCPGPCCYGCYFGSCGNTCCGAGQSCCGRLCCNPGETCCANGAGGYACCGPCETCCNGACCPAGTQCCGNKCCLLGWSCCPDGNGCCPEATSAVEPIVSGGEPVECDGQTCPLGEVCCGETTCCAPCNCCPDGTCCPQACTECIDNGVLSGGTIDVSPDPACVGDTFTFTADGVSDGGGIKRVDCYAKQSVPPVTPTYTWQLTIPPDYPAPLPPLTGSGNVATVEAKVPGTYSATFTVMAGRECPPQPIALGPESATTPDLVAIEWETVSGNTPLDTCPNNGGKRIFPDKLSPTDGAAAQRRDVRIKARISPAVEGCTVHFRTWDVDDPFDQNNASMPNVSLIDGDTSGPDNRPTPEGPVSLVGTTDVLGEARVTFTVSMQPGNNYRAGASIVEAALNGTTQTDADTNTPPDHVRFTDMLTVWRKVHVETDTMVRPTFAQNTFTMPWNEPRQGPVASQVLFDVDDPFTNPFQTNSDQFTNGYVELLRPDGTRLLIARVLGYTNSGAGDDVVLINPDCGNGQIGLQCLGGVVNGDASFSDDDLSDPTVFSAKTWACDNGYAGSATSGALLPPDLSALTSQYLPAYIEPVHEQELSSTGGLVIFLRNPGFGDTSLWGKALWDQAKAPAVRQLPVSASDFWTVMAVSAWQAEEGDDADPNAEAEANGITLGINSHPDGSTTAHLILGSNATGLCAIFKAVTLPGAEATDLGVLAEKMRISHEIGHTLGLPHSDGGHMCASGDCQGEPFTAISLKRLRDFSGP